MAIAWGRKAVTAGMLNEFSRFHSVMISKGLKKKFQMCFFRTRKRKKKKAVEARHQNL